MTAPIDAASLILCTRDGRVLVGTRARAIPFLGGYVAFPGGRLEPEDADRARALFDSAEPEDALRAAALRELAEEAGLTVRDGRAVPAGAPRLAARDLGFAGRWITPAYSPIRFDTRFFLAVVEDDAAPPSRPDEEMEAVEWARPEDLLARHLAQEILLPPPTLVALRALSVGLRGARQRILAHPSARGDEHLDFEPLAGVRQLPLRTPTLPPATTTNAYVLGHERLLIVDPATYDADERDKLLCLVEELTDRGATVEAVVLTHHHRDHVGAAQWISKKTGAPIWAHAVTKALLTNRVRVDATLDDGDRIDLGVDARGAPFAWEVLFTPGHAPGHVVLRDLRPGARCLVVGDMVAAVGTIIVDPPEGDMAEYIRQLRRLRALPPAVLMPAHGPPIVDGHAKLDQYVAHRLMREEKVLGALRAAGQARPEELLDVAYADTPKKLHPLAARACLAHLEKLVHDGVAVRRGNRFAAATP